MVIIMRMDKFLKVSRIIKRRTLAKELTELGRVEINGKISKPSSEVKVGDILKIELRDYIMVAKVNLVKDNVRANEAAFMYEIISEEFKKSE